MVVSNFIAGAIGSAVAGLLWSAGGWTAVTSTGMIFAALGLGAWLLGRRVARHLASQGGPPSKSK